MKNPYEVLGMTADSDPDALRARYEALRARYSEQRFADGEIGNEGARLLNELESSWKIIQEDIRKAETRKNFGGDYGQIEKLIRSASYDDAQAALDSIQNRDAKWHYYQSIIFYKREWLSESRTQLNIAIQLEPNNAKYKESLKKLDLVMGNPNVDPNNVGNGRQSGPYDYSEGNAQYQQQPPPQQTNDAVNTCANCAMCYCMTEMCCTMSRCCH